MSLNLREERREGDKGISLAVLRDYVNQAVAYSKPGDDLTQVFPSVQTTLGGKPLIKKISLELP